MSFHFSIYRKVWFVHSIDMYELCYFQLTMIDHTRCDPNSLEDYINAYTIPYIDVKKWHK